VASVVEAYRLRRLSMGRTTGRKVTATGGTAPGRTRGARVEIPAHAAGLGGNTTLDQAPQLETQRAGVVSIERSEAIA